MTIGTTISEVTVEGNGATTAFAYPFLIPAASDVVVTYTAPSGTQSVLLNSQYTITGIGLSAGGNVTYPLAGSPIASGSSLTIQRVLPQVQTTSLSNQGPTFAAIESALDYLTMLTQQVSAQTSARAITGNVADPLGLNYQVPAVAARALQVLGFDSGGNVIAAQPSSALVSSAMQPVVAAASTSAALTLLGVSSAMQPVVGAATIAAAAIALNVLALSGGAITGSTTISASFSAAEVGVFTKTQMNTPYTFLLGGISPTTEYTTEHPGDYATQALVGGVAIPSSSAVIEADGIYAYVTSNSTATNAVGGGFSVRGLKAGTFLFGLNPIVDDGTYASTVVGCEWDIGGKNTGSIVYGSNMIGVFPNGTPGTAVAYQAAALNAAGWEFAFLTGNGSAAVGIQLGAAGTTANSDGQTINLYALDNSATARAVGIQAVHETSGANLVFVTPTGSSQFSQLVGFEAAIIVVAATGVIESFYSGSSQVGSITTAGSATAYNTTSDYRLKNLFGASDGSVIDKLTVHVGAFKADAGGTKRSMLIAHEAQEHAPWAVYGEKDATHPEDVSGYRPVLLHKKGDTYEADVIGQEYGVVHAEGDLYEADVFNDIGVGIHKKGDRYTKAVMGKRDVVLHRKGDPYTADEWGRQACAIHKAGDINPQMVDHQAFVPDLIAKCQMLSAEIAQVAADLATFKATVSMLQKG